MRWRSMLTVSVCMVSMHFAGAETATPPLQSFDHDIRPILQKCIRCHGPDRPEADLCLTNRDSTIQSQAIVPHDPDSSTLLERVMSSDPDIRMPPDEALSGPEIDRLRQWIESGAVWPEHWSYQALTRPDPPELVSPSLAKWSANPIDRFVAARLLRAGLQPSPSASRRTWLRRVYYDLIGLPPSIQAITSFQNDQSPNAFEKVVDRLLADPHYGERWSRHWMDVVHFAETHGHDQDRPREHAWPYRDYLVNRFNDDIAYDRFIREQIAGDVVSPGDPWSIVGTGLLASGPWDESSLRDIQEDSIDREIGRYLDRDDIVTTVMSTFASTSVHCARCHHHKFDPVTQDEYYGLQAIFAGIDKANRAYDPDAEVAKRRAELHEAIENLDSWFKTQSPNLLSDELQGSAHRWEQTHGKTNATWMPLEIVEAHSGAGQTLEAADDRSVFASGDRPDKDTYTLIVTTALADLRAIRLSVLADPRLPMLGPGRNDNGNFHLNQVRLFNVDPTNRDQLEQIEITAAISGFDQTGWGVSNAIDGNPNTAWGIHPKVGQAHHAVFTFEPPHTKASHDKVSKSTLLRIEMDQLHGGGHLIGKFALECSNQTGPYPIEPTVPNQIANLLRLDRDARTDAQRMELAAYVERSRLDQELAALPEPALVYCGTNLFEPEGSFRPSDGPREVRVLDRGEIDSPLRLARPNSLSAIESVPFRLPPSDAADEKERRAALADWLADQRNGLVWRSIANRVWHYHYGKPLVDTPNDFGVAGSSPTHPELLDWLAVQLQSAGGSLKSLHRLIVTSATYRQSSRYREDAANIDAENRLVWRMNRRRMDAESFRDSLLVVSKTLDRRMGGPSDRQFNQSKGVHVTPVVDYNGFDVDDAKNFRRSVYRFLFRTIPDPFMAALDCPDAAQLIPQRTESVTPVQALATMNDKFVIRQSEWIASRIVADQHATDESANIDRVRAAYRLVLGREPTPTELQLVHPYAEQHGLKNVCRLLLNTNEFMFVD